MPLAAVIGAVATIGSAAISSSAASSSAKSQENAATAASAQQQAAALAGGQIVGAGDIAGAGTAAAGDIAASQLQQAYDMEGAQQAAQGYQQAQSTLSTAGNLAAGTQLNQYQTTAGNLSPFINTGSSAISQLANLFGLGPGGNGIPNTQALTSALTATPGYQFGLSQGQQQLNATAAARGGLLSGSQLEAAQQYGTNYAQQQAYAPYVSGLQSLAQGGQTAATSLGTLGGQAASGAAQDYLTAGQGVANAQVGAGNVLGSGLTAGGAAFASGLNAASNAQAAGQINSAAAIGGSEIPAATAAASGIAANANITNSNSASQLALAQQAGSQLYGLAQQQSWWPTSTTGAGAMSETPDYAAISAGTPGATF